MNMKKSLYLGFGHLNHQTFLDSKAQCFISCRWYLSPVARTGLNEKILLRKYNIVMLALGKGNFYLLITYILHELRDLVPFVQFKKREKHP